MTFVLEGIPSSGGPRCLRGGRFLSLESGLSGSSAGYSLLVKQDISTNWRDETYSSFWDRSGGLCFSPASVYAVLLARLCTTLVVTVFNEVIKTYDSQRVQYDLHGRHVHVLDLDHVGEVHVGVARCRWHLPRRCWHLRREVRVCELAE